MAKQPFKVGLIGASNENDVTNFMKGHVPANIVNPSVLFGPRFQSKLEAWHRSVLQ